MRFSKSLIKTTREKPSNVESETYSLMIRSGMIKQESAGLFTYLPYFNMLMQKVESVIREEMNKLDGQECKFPILVSKTLLNASGRWDAFGNEMFALKDRHGNDYALSPTNEEAAAMTAKQFVSSFRDLPLTIYQINTKHRDEIRPNGIGRTRAFTMKDAYSFHATDESLDDCYSSMIEAYKTIFRRLGLNAFPVNADNGSMGGSGSQEVMAELNEGDNEVAICEKCGYAANLEVMSCYYNENEVEAKNGIYEKVQAPKFSTVKELCDFFSIPLEKCMISFFYKTDSGKIVLAVVRGDRQLNEVKLRNFLKAQTIELLSANEINELGSNINYCGPIGLDSTVEIILDEELKYSCDYISGSNDEGFYYKNANIKDINDYKFADIRFATSNEVHSCGGKLRIVHATELGHCFKLGKRYTEKLDVNYMDSDGHEKAMTMGCYGIGIERTVTAIIDKYHDDKGICFPMHIAPFKVSIIPITEVDLKVAEIIHDSLTKERINCLLDDRQARPGVKFKDSDLLGIPIKIIVGKKYNQDSILEIEFRDGRKEDIPFSNIVEYIKNVISKEEKEFLFS